MTTLTLYLAPKASGTGARGRQRAVPELVRVQCSNNDETIESGRDVAGGKWKRKPDTRHLLIFLLLDKYHAAAGLGEPVEQFVAACHPSLKQLAEQCHRCDVRKGGWLYAVFGLQEKVAGIDQAIEYVRGRELAVRFKSPPDAIRVAWQTRPGDRLPVRPETAEEIGELLRSLGVDLTRASAGTSRTPVIPLAELGPFLRNFRADRDLIGVCHALPDTAAWDRAWLERFENGEVGDYHRLSDLQPLIQAYQAKPILVDWMASTPRSLVVHERLGDFQVFRQEDAACGLGCRYLFPKTRLRDVDAALVAVDLAGVPPERRAELDRSGGLHPYVKDGQLAREAVPHTDQHTHPGDELLFVVEGTVEVHLRNDGLRERLTQGDYVHFEAEQEHVIWNPSESPARVLVIRFYQIKHEGTRRSLIRDLGLVLNNAEDDPQRVQRVRQWLHQVVSAPAGRADRVPERIVDKEGLARRIEQLAGYRKLNANALQREFVIQGGSVEHLDALLRADPRSSERVESLELLAKVFRIPRVLLDDALVPASPRCVLVRRDDWVPSSPLARLAGVGARYSLPCRTLAGSDIAINLLELTSQERKGQSPLNDHPGSELVLCLTGEAVLQFGPPATARPSAKRGTAQGRGPRGSAGQGPKHVQAGQFVHYDSSFPHIVLNPCPGTTSRLLVIRFYAADQGRTPA